MPECHRHPPEQDVTWNVWVDAPPHLAWKFEVQSLMELVAAFSELVCHVVSCGDSVHGLSVRVVPARGARQKTAIVPSEAISEEARQTPSQFGSHLIIVPCSQPRLVKEGYAMNSALTPFAAMSGVVLAAFCALLAGIFQVFVFVSRVKGEKGTVKVGNPFATIIFVLCALLCVTLVLHKVNRHLGKITLSEADPAIIFFLVGRQWVSLTYNNFMILGSWATWFDDAGRLAIDLIFCLCISVCDAWNVRTIIKCLFLICCLMWSGVKWFIGVATINWVAGMLKIQFGFNLPLESHVIRHPGSQFHSSYPGQFYRSREEETSLSTRAN